MKVRLLSQQVGKGGIKMARRHLQSDGTYRIPDTAQSVVIELSDKSAQKYIDRGLAEPFNESETA
jgi:hypothetical protein